LKDFASSQRSSKRDQYVVIAHWDNLFKPTKSTNNSMSGDGAAQTTIVQLFDNFYRILFELAPEVKPLFRSSMQVQGKALVNIVGAIKGMLMCPDILDKASRLAGRHVKYGIKPEYFNALGLTLIKTLQSCSGASWNTEVEGAWKRVYTHVAIIVISSLEKQLKGNNRSIGKSVYSAISHQSRTSAKEEPAMAPTPAPSKDATCPFSGHKLSDMPHQQSFKDGKNGNLAKKQAQCPFRRFGLIFNKQVVAQ
jgi:nitric oxide dioxygenase